MTKKIKTSRRGSKSKNKNVTFSNLLGGKSDFYEPGKYPFTSAQFFKKSNITNVPLVNKQNSSKNLSSKNVKPAPVVSILKTNSKSNIKPKLGGKSMQDPSNANFTSANLKTTSSRGAMINSDKFNRQWSVRKQYANYPMNTGIYASSMPAAKSNTGGKLRRSKKSRKTKTKKTVGGKNKGKPKSQKTHSKRY